MLGRGRGSGGEAEEEGEEESWKIGVTCVDGVGLEGAETLGMRRWWNEGAE